MALSQPILEPLVKPLPKALPKALQPRPSLRLLPQLRTLPEQKAKPVTFAVILSALLVMGSLVLLLVNTMMAQDAFVLNRLKQQVSTLTDQEQAITALTSWESSPSSLAAKAMELGMVPGGTPVFLDLQTGKVIGVTKKSANRTTASR